MVEEPELLPLLWKLGAILFKTREQEMADCWLQTKKIYEERKEQGVLVP
jgi:hypothetical protein